MRVGSYSVIEDTEENSHGQPVKDRIAAQVTIIYPPHAAKPKRNFPGVIQQLTHRMNFLEEQVKKASALHEEIQRLKAKLRKHGIHDDPSSPSPYQLKQILSRRIDSFDFSEPLLSILHRENIQTVKDLAKLGIGDFLRFKKANKRTLKEAESFLHAYGLDWNTKI